MIMFVVQTVKITTILLENGRKNTAESNHHRKLPAADFG